MEAYTNEQETPQQRAEESAQTPVFLSEGADLLIELPRSTPDHIRSEVVSRFCQSVAQWHEGGDQQRQLDCLANFGRFILVCRLERGLSVAELAQRSATDEETLFLLERGLVPQDEVDSLLPKLAHALDISPEKLKTILESEPNDAPL